VPLLDLGLPLLLDKSQKHRRLLETRHRWKGSHPGALLVSSGLALSGERWRTASRPLRCVATTSPRACPLRLDGATLWAAARAAERLRVFRHPWSREASRWPSGTRRRTSAPTLHTRSPASAAPAGVPRTRRALCLHLLASTAPNSRAPSPRKVTLAWLAAEFAIDVWHSLTHGVLACGPQASALEPPAGVAAPARAPGIAAGRAHGKPPASRPSRRALRNSFACVSAPYPQHRLCVATPAPPAGCAASDGHAVDDGARHDSAHANAAQLWRDSSAEREWWWWWCCRCSRGLPTGFADKLDSRAVCLCDANPAQNLSNTDMGMLRNTALPPVRPFKGPAISEWQSAGVVGGTSGKVRFSTRSLGLILAIDSTA
jgi:hypothetical protein